MFIYAMVAVTFVAVYILYEIVLEDSVKHLKQYMAEEYQFTHKKRVVLQGIFRKHNEAFRDKGPRGTA